MFPSLLSCTEITIVSLSHFRWGQYALLLIICLIIEAVFILASSIHLITQPNIIKIDVPEATTAASKPADLSEPLLPDPFLKKYQMFCETYIRPRLIMDKNFTQPLLPLCPCVPDTLSKV